VVGLLKLSGTGCVGHREVPADPHRGHPAAPRCQYLSTDSPYSPRLFNTAVRSEYIILINKVITKLPYQSHCSARPGPT